jgi:hypothetical protein
MLCNAQLCPLDLESVVQNMYRSMQIKNCFSPENPMAKELHDSDDFYDG